MDCRIEFVARALQENTNFSQLCREFEITRRTGYKWVHRYQQVGSFAELAEKSRRPHTSPNRTAMAIENRVLQLRKDHGWGGHKIQEVLARDEQIEVKEITVNRILKRGGQVKEEDSHPPATQRYEREHPNELWQMDFKGDYPMEGGRCHPLSILDDHSRFAVGLHKLANQSGESVYTALLQTFEQSGVPEAMLMDHGTPWWGTTNGHGLTWVSVALIQQGICLLHGRIRHPQTQGKVERFHRTPDESIRHHGQPTTPQEWDDFFARFCVEYNTVRPHEALGMKVPADRYQPSSKTYTPHPPEWVYPEGSTLRKLNTQGCLDYRKHRYFVCEALAGEWVRIQEVQDLFLVSYRPMYIREIEKDTGRGKAIVKCIED